VLQVQYTTSVSLTSSQTPDIIITLPSEGLKLHQEATIQVAFKNPLSKRLTNGKFYLHGEGFVTDMTADIR